MACRPLAFCEGGLAMVAGSYAYEFAVRGLCGISRASHVPGIPICPKRPPSFAAPQSTTTVAK